MRPQIKQQALHQSNKVVATFFTDFVKCCDCVKIPGFEFSPFNTGKSTTACRICLVATFFFFLPIGWLLLLVKNGDVWF